MVQVFCGIWVVFLHGLGPRNFLCDKPGSPRQVWLELARLHVEGWPGVTGERETTGQGSCDVHFAVDDLIETRRGSFDVKLSTLPCRKRVAFQTRALHFLMLTLLVSVRPKFCFILGHESQCVASGKDKKHTCF